MGDYVITVNSTVDLPKEWLEERNVPVMALKYTICLLYTSDAADEL